ncbi:hypothetical protein [Paenibacillus dendrobii]|uniref:hypothetical protein n=1 Tax=Paenibacillus dendrobii TaxID=2691084 RepID=UPI001F3F4CD4|nr:hypothetical protein [Paenibacillus dendrobii]
MEHLKAKAATQKENEEWDDLYQYIIKLHDLVVLPKGNITRLKDLRSGFVMKNGKKVKQWRTGPDFNLMLDAYKLSEDSIRWCIKNKLDGSNDVKAVNYGISIMIDKLNEANERKKNRQRQLEQIQLESKNTKGITNYEVIYKPKSENDNDISEFL